ncbi:MAG: hypothetical protein HY456_00535 [Parcubacteria group bacterium]|nr:hypothetical protein [Parcubacteria group bacterium]
MPSVILKKGEELLKSENFLKEFLICAKNSAFWREYFRRCGLLIEAERFTWEEWQRLPFMTKKAFSEIGFGERLRDAEREIGKDIYNFLLRVTSGTTGGEPILMLRDSNFEGAGGYARRSARFYKPFGVGLRWVLLSVLSAKKDAKRPFQFLVIGPEALNFRLPEAFRDFGAGCIEGIPANLVRFVGLFSGNQNFLGGVKKIIFSGDFMSAAENAFVRSFFESLDESSFASDYVSSEAGKLGESCVHLRKKYNSNGVYHPAVKNGFIELVDIDENGYGEIVVTKLVPFATALLRYRSGDLGRAVFEDCPCGKSYALFLAGRKDFDYLKIAGALILRAELERVLDAFSDYVSEWRAEAEEIVGEGDVKGELRIKIKPGPKMIKEDVNSVDAIAVKISENCYLTPRRTLLQLVEDNKFLPLKIEVVEEFPPVQKKIVLRKVA